MKKFFLSYCFYLITILGGMAQAPKQETVSKLVSVTDQINQSVAKMDLSSIKTGFFLNKGFPFSQQIKPFTDPAYNKPRMFKGRYWQALQRGILKSDIKDRQSFPSLDSELEAIQTKSSETAVIPVGIINVTGNFLTEKEVKENMFVKSNGGTVTQDYRTVQLFSAAALVGVACNKQVTFVFDSRFFLFDDPADITQLEIDLGDDKGYRPVDLNTTSSTSISTIYSGIGEKLLTFRFNSKRAGQYICYSSFTVSMSELPAPWQTLDIQAPKTVTEKQTGSPNGRASVQLTGGQANIYLGCDGVFDKPVIIVEGFDASNEIGFSQLLNASKYGSDGVFRALHQAGYDRVILNFNDGGDYIQNNAQVLIELINRVNQLKPGNAQPSILIGESMGGIVARIALTVMEHNGQAHQVSHYISYDSPHIGANVPLGEQHLGHDITDVGVVDLFNLAPVELRKIVGNANTPAAFQMLKYHYTMPGGQPHPYYDFLQSYLQYLGFPTQCRNIAIIHGSQNGTNYGFGPESDLIYLDLINPIVSVFARARSHDPLAQLTLSSLTGVFFIGIPLTVRIHDLLVQGPNYDYIAGGNTPRSDLSTSELLNFSGTLINVLFNIGYNDAFVQQDICFVPSLSAIAYTGPLNSQADWATTVNAARSAGQTPFQAIYATDQNTHHVDTGELYGTWRQLFDTEFNIPANSYSSTCPSAPPANWTGNQFVCAGSTYQYQAGSPSEITNISYKWTVQPGGYTYYGNPVTIYWNHNPGVYYLTCEAQDTSSPYNPVGTSTGNIYLQNCTGTDPGPGQGGCYQASITLDSPTNGTTFNASSFPYYFDIQTTACDPQGIDRVRYFAVAPDGSFHVLGDVVSPGSGPHPYTWTAALWASNVANNNGYQFTQPGTYRLSAQLISNSGSAIFTNEISVTINQAGGGNPPITGSNYDQCFEAEAATGSGSPNNDANASGGQYVGTFGNAYEHRDFAVNNIPSTGSYTLKIRYASGESPNMGIVVNGAGAIGLSAPTTQSWGGNYNEVSTNINLLQGGNTIRIQGGNGSFVLDRICVSGGNNGGRSIAANQSNSSDDPLTIRLYPNPAAVSTVIEYDLHEGQGANISITDAAGRQKAVYNIIGEGSVGRKTVNTQTWPDGMYFIKMSTVEGSVEKKLFVHH